MQTGTYLLHCQRYIELNPVRAGMVWGPAEYPWSSYRSNGMGVESGLCSPYELYPGLGASKAQLLQAYRALFDAHVEGSLLTEIRNTVNQGMALGAEHYNRTVRCDWLGQYLLDSLDEIQRFATRWLWHYNLEPR